MFLLHAKIRRTICMALFALLAMAPTLFVAGWCVWRKLPDRADEAAQWLADRLGLRVAVAAIQHVKPGITRFEGVHVADPESNRPILFAQNVTLREETVIDAQGQSAAWWILDSDQIEIGADSLGELGQILERLMQLRAGFAEPRFRIQAAEVLVHAADRAYPLTDARFTVESLPTGVQSQITFREGGSNAQEPAQITISRNRQTRPPSVRLELATGQNPLPGSLLALAFPDLAIAGPHARFQGYVWATRSADEWTGELAGQLSSIDLDHVIRQCSSHKFTGTAQLTVQAARFKNGRVDELSGLLAAGPGVISRPLMAAAVDRLGLNRPTESAVPGDLVPYDQFAVAFLIDHNGLRMQGRCNNGQVGTIMTDRAGRLLGDPLVQPRPATALAQILTSPQGSIAGGKFLQWLPLPDTATPPLVGQRP